MKLIILSAKSIPLLEKEAEKYDIGDLGSIAISNGHYFLAILGKLKEEPKAAPKATSSSAKKTTRNPRVPK